MNAPAPATAAAGPGAARRRPGWCGPCREKTRAVDERPGMRIWLCDSCQTRYPQRLKIRPAQLELFHVEEI